MNYSNEETRTVVEALGHKVPAPMSGRQWMLYRGNAALGDLILTANGWRPHPHSRRSSVVRVCLAQIIDTDNDRELKQTGKKTSTLIQWANSLLSRRTSSGE